MKIINVTADEKNQLFLEIDRHLSVVHRRNVAYLLNTFSGELATITLFVNGKKGTSQKNITLHKVDGLWYVFDQTSVYELKTLSEISSICKGIVQRLYVIVGKF